MAEPLTDGAVAAAADLPRSGYFLSREDVAQLANALLEARARIAELEAGQLLNRNAIRLRGERIATLERERDLLRAVAKRAAVVAEYAVVPPDVGRALDRALKALDAFDKENPSHG